MNNKLLNNHRNKNKINKINMARQQTDKNQTNNNIANIIINTQKSNVNNSDIKTKLANKEKEYSDVNLKEYWKGRNNDPYKVIFKNDTFVNKQYNNIDDLIVHKVTDADKEGLDEEFDAKQKDITSHNNELKKIYADKKKEEHHQRFVYNNCYKYKQQQTKPSDFVTMKDAANDDKNKDNMPEIMEHIVCSGILKDTSTDSPNEHKNIQKVNIIKSDHSKDTNHISNITNTNIDTESKNNNINVPGVKIIKRR